MEDTSATSDHGLNFPSFAVTVDLAIFTVAPREEDDERELQVLLIRRGLDQTPHSGEWALPGGFVGLEETLEEAAARRLKEKTGIIISQKDLRQLRTFGDPERDKRATADRVVTVAYAKLQAGCTTPKPAGGVADAAFFPVASISDVVDKQTAKTVLSAFDHWTIFQAALARIRKDLEETPIAVEFLNPQFTISELHAVYRAVWGEAVHQLDPANFRRRVLAIQKGSSEDSETSFLKAIFQEKKGPKGEALPATKRGNGRSAALYEFGGIDKLEPPYRMPIGMPQKSHSQNGKD